MSEGVEVGVEVGVEMGVEVGVEVGMLVGVLVESTAASPSPRHRPLASGCVPCAASGLRTWAKVICQLTACASWIQSNVLANMAMSMFISSTPTSSRKPSR